MGSRQWSASEAVPRCSTLSNALSGMLSIMSFWFIVKNIRCQYLLSGKSSPLWEVQNYFFLVSLEVDYDILI